MDDQAFTKSESAHGLSSVEKTGGKPGSGEIKICNRSRGLLEHAPSKIGALEKAQGELSEKVDTVVSTVEDVKKNVEEMKKKQDGEEKNATKNVLNTLSQQIGAQESEMTAKLTSIEGKIDELIKDKSDKAKTASMEKYTPTEEKKELVARESQLETKLAAIEEKIDNFVQDQAGKTEAASKQESKQSELDAKLEAVQEKIEQILARLNKPPLPAPKLTKSALEVPCTEPLQPVIRNLTSGVCERSVETTPIDLPTPSLSVSVIASQEVAPIDQPLPGFGVSTITSLSTGSLVVREAPRVESGVQTDATTQQLSIGKIITNATVPLGTDPHLVLKDLAQENVELKAKIEKMMSDHQITQAELVKAQEHAANIQQHKMVAENAVANFSKETMQLGINLEQTDEKLRNTEADLKATRTDLAKSEKKARDNQYLIEQVGVHIDELTVEKAAIEKNWLVAKSELAASQAEINKTTQRLTKLSQQYLSTCDNLASEQKQVLETKGALQAAELDLATAKTKLGGAQLEIVTLNQDLNANAATFGRMVDTGIDVEVYINDRGDDFDNYLDDFENELAQHEEGGSITVKEEQSTKRPVVEVTSTIVAGLNAGALGFKPTLQPSSTPIEDQTAKSEAYEDEKNTDVPVVEVTSQSEAGLKGSEDAHSGASSTLNIKSSDKSTDSNSAQSEQIIDNAVEVKTPVKMLTGMGMSRYAVETPFVLPVKQDTIVPSVKEVKGAATLKPAEEAKDEKAITRNKNGQAVAGAKPAVKDGLGNSRYASASSSTTLTPRPTLQPPATKSKIDETEKQARTIDDVSRLQQEKITAGAGEVDGATELKFCLVCNKLVQVEVHEEFEYSKKKFFDDVPVPIGSKKTYIWDGHNFDFHDKCPDCRIDVCAPYDSNSDKNDFSEHKKVCSRRRTSSTPSSGLRAAPVTTTSSSSKYTGRHEPKRTPETEHPDGLERCKKCSIWLDPTDRKSFHAHIKACNYTICNHQGCGLIMLSVYFFKEHHELCKPGGTNYHHAQHINENNTAKTGPATQSPAASAPTEDTNKATPHKPSHKYTGKSTPLSSSPGMFGDQPIIAGYGAGAIQTTANETSLVTRGSQRRGGRLSQSPYASQGRGKKTRDNVTAGRISEVPRFTGRVIDYSNDY